MADFSVTDWSHWPASREDLIALQNQLGRARPVIWQPGSEFDLVGGCFVCYPKAHPGSGSAGDPCWAAAVLLKRGSLIASAVFRGTAGYRYEPGLLALREGPLLEAALRRLPTLPQVLLVNATGWDHPRRAGLALHLGAVLSLPTVGVTRNPLLAEGAWPANTRGARAPLKIGEETVGFWLCTKSGSPPLAVHAAWRTNPETAVSVVMAVTGRWRTPEPLRQARQAARLARAAEGRWACF